MGACLLMSVAFFPALNFLVTFFFCRRKSPGKGKDGRADAGSQKASEEAVSRRSLFFFDGQELSTSLGAAKNPTAQRRRTRWISAKYPRAVLLFICWITSDGGDKTAPTSPHFQQPVCYGSPSVIVVGQVGGASTPAASLLSRATTEAACHDGNEFSRRQSGVAQDTLEQSSGAMDQLCLQQLVFDLCR